MAVKLTTKNVSYIVYTVAAGFSFALGVALMSPSLTNNAMTARIWLVGSLVVNTALLTVAAIDR